MPPYIHRSCEEPGASSQRGAKPSAEGTRGVGAQAMRAAAAARARRPLLPAVRRAAGILAGVSSRPAAGPARAAARAAAAPGAGGCRRRLATAATSSEPGPAAAEPPAATLDANLRKLLFMVHPDLFPEGSDARAANLEAVKTINSYVDAHRPLIEGADDAELPPPGQQPAMARLYVRQKQGEGAQPAAAEVGPLTAMLHATTQAQPQGFEKSIDKLFALVGLPQIYTDGNSIVLNSFNKGSVGFGELSSRDVPSSSP